MSGVTPEKGEDSPRDVVLSFPPPGKTFRARDIIIDPTFRVAEVVPLTAEVVDGDPTPNINKTDSPRDESACTYLPSVTLISTLILAPTLSLTQ